MARRRYISTEISIDEKLDNVSDFAALLYTWGIPHAKDDCRISPQNAAEHRKRIVPGRNKSVAEVEKALDELISAGLLGVDENSELYYPSKSFYKYQTYINAANRRETPQNAASPSLSLSPSLIKKLHKNVVKKESPTSSSVQAKRATRFPDNFEVKPELLLWALSHEISEPEKELEAFHDYHVSKGSVFLDWNAAFRTWLRNSKRFSGNGKAVQVEGELSDRSKRILRRGLP